MIDIDAIALNVTYQIENAFAVRRGKGGYVQRRAAVQIIIARALCALSPPEPTEGQSDPENRMAQIETIIADLQSVRDRFGNTCVYIRRYGFSWGAVALNYKADDEKNGVFKLNEEYDRRLIAHSEQVDRLKASRDEAYARADKAEKELAALRAMPLHKGTET